MNAPELLPHLFRTEYSKIVAVLCNTFGLHHMEVAEDIASETFLKATEIWGLKGLPANPTAWLYTVAKNETKDYFKRRSVFDSKVKGALQVPDMEMPESFEFSDEVIADSQLAMIFAVCHPANAVEAQICLALQILCGFSVEEIANAFLTNRETIKKRLLRARAAMRNDNFRIKSLSEAAIQSRLNAVLKTLYLLFNEGYFSKTQDQAIRKDLCTEAIRLATLLTDNPLTNTSPVNALLSLFCFQSSRLDARTNDRGEAVLFDEQDRSLWDQSLIDKGNLYLIEACKGDELSKYHLEAAIAYWHATPNAVDKWQHILGLYDQLMRIDQSPAVALNRAFAVARVHGSAKAIPEVEQLAMPDSSYYHCLLGYLYAGTNVALAITHYSKAAALTRSAAEKQTLNKEIARLNS